MPTDESCTDWMEAAHMLKGGAAGIGAETLRRLCEQAQLQEHASRAERSRLFEQIAQAYSEVKNHLVAARYISPD